MALPRFSVVVPTYNRPQQLFRCLEALSKSDYPCDRMQIILVDDGSSDPLDELVAPFQSHDQLMGEVVLLRQKNAGPATARNTGANHASGDYIAFTDDDCMPSTDWLHELAKAAETSPDAMLGGRTLNALPQNVYSTASQALIDYLYDYYSSATTGIFFASNNIAMKRSHFLSIGGFDTAFPLAAAEDRNLCDCWQQAGFPMRYVPSATVQHAHALSLQTFWKQHFSYGRGAFHFHTIRAQRTDNPIKVEPFQFYRDLLTYPMRQSEIDESLQVSSLFFLSQFATTVGFFFERYQNRTPLQLGTPA